MKTITSLFIFLFLSTSIPSCEDFLNVEKIPPVQEILFQYEYINHAWGYQHSGWLVDSTGSIYCYKLPEGWNHPDSLGMLSEAEMLENIALADSVCSVITVEEVVEKSALIEEAAKGSLSEPEYVMADAGSWSYYAFIFNEINSNYQRILIRQMGDARVFNSADEADLLYEWLDSIKQTFTP